MKQRKGPITAAELMKQLAADPEFVRMRQEKDERYRLKQERLDAIKRPLFEDLSSAGFPATSIGQLIETYAPLPSEIVEILLSWLSRCHEERIQEMLVRALAAAKSSFDGRQLVTCFESTSDEGVRFAVLNTIALTRPYSIESWIEKARQNDYLHQKLSDLGYQWPMRGTE